MDDYYSILGVSPIASNAEIKQNYRKLAMKHHPDRGGDASVLSKINEAYAVLGDPQKRSDYDNPVSDFRVHTGNFDDAFRNGFSRQRTQQRNKDVKLQCRIDLIDCFNGKNLSLAYTLPSGGTELIDVTIPVGAKQGDVVVFEHHGDNSNPYAPRGNLILEILVNKDSHWEQSGSDLYTQHNIDVLELCTGCKVDLKTPDAKTLALTIPPGTDSGTCFSIPEHGLPNTIDNTRGKIYITVQGKTPKLNDEQKQQVLDIKNAINKSA